MHSVVEPPLRVDGRSVHEVIGSSMIDAKPEDAFGYLVAVGVVPEEAQTGLAQREGDNG
jgi:hypothetical protein